MLVVGSEGRGLSRVVAERCDLLARIPIGAAESLNAGTAWCGTAGDVCGCSSSTAESTRGWG